MPAEFHDVRRAFERGVVVLSLDTEQIWGYLDVMNEAQFRDRYPDAPAAHDKLLDDLRTAGVSATWFVVGGLALGGSDGARDRRMSGLPGDWAVRIPGGREADTPLWYRQSFVRRLGAAHPFQEIGLHGGLTHFIWTDARASQDVVEWELAEGIRALNQAHVHPLSFSFGRQEEAYYELLPAHGVRCYRGCTVGLDHQLRPPLCGALLRLLDEVRRATPPPVWPHETIPGLWNIPASLFLYPIGRMRTRMVGLQSRVQRFAKGLEAAARYRGIFHFCLHPENLAESPGGFSMFEDILDLLTRARERGDIQILTMREVVALMDRACEQRPQPRCELHSKGTQSRAS